MIGLIVAVLATAAALWAVGLLRDDYSPAIRRLYWRLRRRRY